jgi:putative NIF3 family GTP cyclohydrolase 1 type 2
MEINNAARALAIANQNLKIADSNLIQAKIEMGMAIGAYALAGMLVSSTFAAMLFTCGSPDPITKAGCPAAIRAFIGALAPLAAAKYAVEKVKNNLALVQAAYDAAVQAQKDAQAYYDGCCAMALVWEDIVESLEKQVKQAKIRVYNAQKAYDDCVAACSGG